jgi:hypothetical protein
VIAMLYASSPTAPLADESLRQLADEAGRAYERLIRSSRR